MVGTSERLVLDYNGQSFPERDLIALDSIHLLSANIAQGPDPTTSRPYAHNSASSQKDDWVLCALRRS